ncbi:hypothetical protein K2F40_16500 [Clostridium sp. CM028]|uniref:hypothetical protein n=1 Tax=Clostridium sp. CM028 TaxID=2851575 RepID=UPI001C6E10DA|nr:hypothetical protein [Clostridium sp. CM028]MBW9150537.1 hypothetical protein [Clostridium sp. CM028]WLC62536.1 hypothetical protein KTC94_04455 [Clostridium sp. CM028]
MKVYREKDSSYDEFNTINYFLHIETAVQMKNSIDNNPDLMYEINEIDVICD